MLSAQHFLCSLHILYLFSFYYLSFAYIIYCVVYFETHKMQYKFLIYYFIFSMFFNRINLDFIK